jgi:hypothetical protein
MYQLFSTRITTTTSIVRPPEFELIKRIYEREVLNIVSYFNNRTYYIKNTHLLVRILNLYTIPLDYTLDRYAETAASRSPYISKQFNFTSDINYGRFHDGPFYGEGNQELILSVDDYFDPYSEIKNWKTIQAVTVLHHSISDLSLILPNGFKNSTDSGLAVIGINLPLLLLQYRGFLEDQTLKSLTGTAPLLSSNHFVYMYVLPNMLASHVDLVILNRLMNIYYGAPMGSGLKKYPFQVVDYSSKVDNVLKKVLKNITDVNKPYYSSLKTIPAIFGEDMQDSLLMPDLVRTRQVWWALLLTRLNVIKFLIEIGGHKGRVSNISYINKFRIDIKRLLNDHVMKTLVPEDIYYDEVVTLANLLDI